MGSTRFFSRYFSIFTLIFSLLSPLYAQSGGTVAPGVLVGTEIQNIEKTLGTPALSGALRHEALVNLARLYELSGNIEGAAPAWTRAAAADPVNRDDLALIKGAACYAAMGEWEKAEEAVKTVLLTGRDKRTLLRARLLGAQIGAFQSGGKANGAAVNGQNGEAILVALLDDPDYEEFKPSIYYTLWKTTGADAWKNRLTVEFPRSPEGRIAAGATAAAGSGEVIAAPTAMWLLLPGRERVTIAPAVVMPSTAPATPAATSTAAPSTPGTGAANEVSLQTGLFGREANAQAMVERLKAAGFAPAVSRRIVNGAEYWAVSVSAGSDMTAAILRLKNAGFESYPVFN